MSKASETELGNLHALVASTLASRIAAPLREGETIIPGTEGLAASSSDIQAAIAFLKNNNITADADTNDGLRALREQLDARRKSAKDLMAAQQRAAADLEARLSGSVPGMVQ